MGEVLSSILRLLGWNWKPDRSWDDYVGDHVDDDQIRTQLILPVQLQQPQPPADQSCYVDANIIIDPPHVDGGHQQLLPGILSVASSDRIHNQTTTPAHLDPVIPCNKIARIRRDVTTSERVIPCKKTAKSQRDVTTSERVIPFKKIAKTQRDVTTSETQRDEVVIPCKKIARSQRDVTTSERVIPSKKIAKIQRDVTTSEKTQRDVTTSERVIPSKKIAQRDITTSERVIPSKKIAKTQRDVTTSERVIPSKKIATTQRDVTTSEGVIPCNKITKTQRDVNTSKRVIPSKKITKTQRNVTTSERVVPSNKITKTQSSISISDVTISERAVVSKRIGPYTSSQKILLVGEGDFSFSACLAVSFGSATNMIATSLNTQGFLLKNYANFSANRKKLVNRGCIVLHDIDATQMATHPQLSYMKFDRVVFNFPHSGFRSKETLNIELGRHQRLVSRFLRNAKKMIEEDGQIHISHKCNNNFLKWNIPKLAADQGLFLIQEAKFKLSKFPGYHTKYGFGGDKDFECHPSKTYTFGLTG